MNASWCVCNGGEVVRVELYLLTEMLRKVMEVLEIMQENLKAEWMDWTKERKESGCSQESDIASIQSSV